MKKVSILLVIMAGLVIGSCGGKKQQQVSTETDSVSTSELVPRDRTIYGICTDGTAMNTLEMITDSGDTLRINLEKASENGKVFGGLQVADRVAVVTENNNQDAVIVINLNTLLGDWVMPDPLDGSDEIGIRIKEGGVAESIDQSVIVYRTWKIFNGDLEILLVREGGGDEEEENRYEILALGADTLAYRTLNKPKDEIETFEWGCMTRCSPKPVTKQRSSAFRPRA